MPVPLCYPDNTVYIARTGAVVITRVLPYRIYNRMLNSQAKTGSVFLLLFNGDCCNSFLGSVALRGYCIKQRAVASGFFGGRKTFWKKFSFPRAPILSKTFQKGLIQMYVSWKEHNISHAKSLFLKVFEVGGRGPGEGEAFFKKFLPPPCLMRQPLTIISFLKFKKRDL